MKNNYQKYINEILETKNQIYKDYINSGYKSYIKYIQEELHRCKFKIKIVSNNISEK